MIIDPWHGRPLGWFVTQELYRPFSGETILGSFQRRTFDVFNSLREGGLESRRKSSIFSDPEKSGRRNADRSIFPGFAEKKKKLYERKQNATEPRKKQAPSETKVCQDMKLNPPKRRLVGLISTRSLPRLLQRLKKAKKNIFFSPFVLFRPIDWNSFLLTL